MKGSQLLYIVFAGGLLLLGANPVTAETLKDAIDTMLQSHPEVRSIVHNRLGRDEEVKQARADYLPKVDFEAAFGIEEIQEPVDESLNPQIYKLSLRQNLFAGLATMQEVDRQKSRVRSAAYRLRATADQIALRTAEVYLDVLKQMELVQLAEENLQTHLQIADQIKLRSDAGVSSSAENDQVSGRVALARSNVVIAKTNLADAKSNYMAVVGRFPENLAPPAQPAELPPSLADAEALALAHHPTLKSANADLEARNSQYEVAKAAYMPIVDLELDQTWEEDLDEEGKDEVFLALIRLRYNLFNGIGDEARRVETAHLIDEAREIRNNTHRQVVESIRLSWMAHEAVEQRMSYLQDRVNSTLATAESYTKQFNLGKRSLLDVLDTEAEVIDAKQSLVEAKYDGFEAKYRILNGIGNLVASFGLEYPEESKVDEEDKKQQEETSAS